MGDVVRIAPLLDPTPAAVRAAKADDQAATVAPVQALAPAAAPVVELAVAVAPVLTRPAAVLEQPAQAPTPVEDRAVAEQPVPTAPHRSRRRCAGCPGGLGRFGRCRAASGGRGRAA
ncbi:hypothetical protein ACFU7Y_15240 [Kitasatospora sp. NPDC057542]|uniref:hypothetical protein n=1 Tax=Kitasatospora sp. NPDC057542 TaxID=3346162 RepID=UPI0036A9E09B